MISTKTLSTITAILMGGASSYYFVFNGSDSNSGQTNIFSENTTLVKEDNNFQTSELDKKDEKSDSKDDFKFEYEEDNDPEIEYSNTNAEEFLEIDLGKKLNEYVPVEVPTPPTNPIIDRVGKLDLKPNQYQGIIYNFNIENQWITIQDIRDLDSFTSFNILENKTLFKDHDGRIGNIEDIAFGRSVKITMSAESESEPYDAVIVEFLN